MKRLCWSVLLCLTTAGYVLAQDMPRMTVGYYLYSFGTNDAAGKQNVAQYLSGIRDHLWWQCEYEATVTDLIKFADHQIKTFRETMSDEQFVKFANDTPYGDMVFISLKSTSLTNRPEPCER